MPPVDKITDGKLSDCVSYMSTPDDFERCFPHHENGKLPKDHYKEGETPRYKHAIHIEGTSDHRDHSPPNALATCHVDAPSSHVERSNDKGEIIEVTNTTNKACVCANALVPLSITGKVEAPKYS